MGKSPIRSPKALRWVIHGWVSMRLRRDAVELPGAMRWVRRPVCLVHHALRLVKGMLPHRFAGCRAEITACRQRLDSDAVLVALRSLTEPWLPLLAAPLGFRPHGSAGDNPTKRVQHDLGPDPPATAPYDEHDEQVGAHVGTLTFTKSRYILHNADVYDNGQVGHEWSTFGEWSASDTEEVIRMGWYDASPVVEGEDENLPGVLMRFSIQYFWSNDERTSIVLQDWNDANPKSEYRNYAKVTDPINIQGVWQSHDPDDENLTLTINGDSLLWQHHVRPGMSYDTRGRITGIDTEELFINVALLEENDDDELVETGEMTRFAYVPAYNPDAVVLSPHWEESHQEDGRYTTPNHRHPHGAYWRLMLRQ